MKTVSISGSLRENVGKKDAKQLRKNNLVPCVVYGGQEQILFSVKEKDFINIIYTPEVCFVKLNIDKKQIDAIVQEVQFHPVTDKILHVDFLELRDNKPIIMHIPVKLKGVAPGVLKGGKLLSKSRNLKVKALPANMPDSIDVDISSLEIGNTVKVSNIKNETFEILNPENTVIVGVYVTRAAVTEETTSEKAQTASSTPAAEEKKE